MKRGLTELGSPQRSPQRDTLLRAEIPESKASATALFGHQPYRETSYQQSQENNDRHRQQDRLYHDRQQSASALSCSSGEPLDHPLFRLRPLASSSPSSTTEANTSPLLQACPAPPAITAESRLFYTSSAPQCSIQGNLSWPAVRPHAKDPAAPERAPFLQRLEEKNTGVKRGEDGEESAGKTRKRLHGTPEEGSRDLLASPSSRLPEPAARPASDEVPMALSSLHGHNKAPNDGSPASSAPSSSQHRHLQTQTSGGYSDTLTQMLPGNRPQSADIRNALQRPPKRRRQTEPPGQHSWRHDQELAMSSSTLDTAAQNAAAQTHPQRSATSSSSSSSISSQAASLLPHQQHQQAARRTVRRGAVIAVPEESEDDGNEAEREEWGFVENVGMISDAERPSAASEPPLGEILEQIKRETSSPGDDDDGGSQGSKQGKTERRRWTPEEDELLKRAVKKHNGQQWKVIATEVPGRSHVQCLQRWNKSLNPEVIKGRWTTEEDNLLLDIVAKNPHMKNWGYAAKYIPGRSAKQCRERYLNHLDPEIRRDAWTSEEDVFIIQAQRRLGNKWSEIASYLPGRTEAGIKTRLKLLRQTPKRNLQPSASSSSSSPSASASPHQMHSPPPQSHMHLESQSRPSSIYAHQPHMLQQHEQRDDYISPGALQELYAPSESYGNISRSSGVRALVSSTSVERAPTGMSASTEDLLAENPIYAPSGSVSHLASNVDTGAIGASSSSTTTASSLGMKSSEHRRGPIAYPSSASLGLHEHAPPHPSSLTMPGVSTQFSSMHDVDPGELSQPGLLRPGSMSSQTQPQMAEPPPVPELIYNPVPYSLGGYGTTGLSSSSSSMSAQNAEDPNQVHTVQRQDYLSTTLDTNPAHTSSRPHVSPNAPWSSYEFWPNSSPQTPRHSPHMSSYTSTYSSSHTAAPPSLELPVPMGQPQGIVHPEGQGFPSSYYDYSAQYDPYQHASMAKKDHQ